MSVQGLQRIERPLDERDPLGERGVPLRPFELLTCSCTARVRYDAQHVRPVRPLAVGQPAGQRPDESDHRILLIRAEENAAAFFEGDDPLGAARAEWLDDPASLGELFEKRGRNRLRGR